MDKETTTSVTIDRKTFARLDRLAKANGVSKKEYLSCALEYFEKYGINPVRHESPAQEMQKLIKRCDQVIAFIRKQEQDFLRPACEAMNQMKVQVLIRMEQILSEEKFRRYLNESNGMIQEMAQLASDRGKAIDRAERKAQDSEMKITRNQEVLYNRIDRIEKKMQESMTYIASYMDAKGKTGLLDDISRVYEAEKRKRGTQ